MFFFMLTGICIAPQGMSIPIAMCFGYETRDDVLCIPFTICYKM
nr:hypothetical protein [Klebsiella michiganensis]UWX38476.1 hypothetical protein KK467_p0840 [Klebsiella pneumoniae]